MPPLITSINSSVINLSRQACCAIANLAENVENQNKVVAFGAIPGLVEALLRGGGGSALLLSWEKDSHQLF